ncbi:MAG: adenine phosphoribosyltransferase [Flavobacteriales bacterium]|nr:adenine phosphoribosyltransferase [Flavobacteriales bacterium]
MNVVKEIKKNLRDVVDFPKKGIVFKDITPILKIPKLCTAIINELSTLLDKDVTHVVGVESRGFLFGFLLANKMEIPFVPIRKVGKLPGETLQYKYDLEYGSAEVEIHKNDVQKGWNILIHDDLLATGGTASAAAELVLRLGCKVSAFTFVVNLDFLNGKKEIKEYTNNIISLIEY